MTNRVMALWFPRLGAERWLRLGACPRSVPLVTVEGPPAKRSVVATTAAAEACGLHPGQTHDQAAEICPAVVALPADERAEARLLGSLARAAGWLGLRAKTEGRRGITIHLDAGTAMLGPEEAVVARALTEGARVGLSVRPGVADSALAAWALACHGRSGPGGNGRIARPGRSRAALAPLPVKALGLGPAALRRLGRIGVTRVGEVTDLPPAAIRHYLGAEVADRVEEAFGAEPHRTPQQEADGAEIVPLAPLGRVARRSWHA